MMIQVPVILYDTATTEIYTDLHTLALHAALPIHAVAFEIASGTSRSFPWPKSARPLPSPTTTNTAKPKRLPPLTVLLTRLIWTSFSISSSPCSSSRPRRSSRRPRPPRSPPRPPRSPPRPRRPRPSCRSEEHTSELQSLMRISYAVFCLKKKTSKHSSYNYALGRPSHLDD